MKSLKNISVIVGLVILVTGGIAGPICAYYKGKLDTEAKLASLHMRLQQQHEEIMLALIDIENSGDWTEASVKELAEKIPLAIQIHEYKMHPKEYASPASPTKIKIVLPKKPKKFGKSYRPPNMKWVSPKGP